MNQVLDCETGFMLYRNRVYHTTLGRFVQRDFLPIAIRDPNMYLYVNNRPIQFMDFDGLQTHSITIGNINIDGNGNNATIIIGGDGSVTIGDINIQGDNNNVTIIVNPPPGPTTPPLPPVPVGTKKCQKTVPTNGCGSTWSQYVVPDAPLGFDFSDACNAHDECYGTCGKTKASCDDKFLRDMYSSCSKYKWVTRCQEIANYYFGFVDVYGGSAYDNAQSDYCIEIPADECCP